jgi:sucrose phosphorylase
MKKKQIELRTRVIDHLTRIYPEVDHALLADRLIATMGLDQRCKKPRPYRNLWDEQDVIAITYGDSLQRAEEKPLVTLLKFFRQNFADIINSIHILPFYPWSSDDGFSVINYKQVNETLGDWPEVEAIAREFAVMADLVINHCSSRSLWFEQFKNNQPPGRDYFISADPEADYSEVIRPRTSPLLKEVETLDGARHVWCTFSHDQIDLNFANPDLLLEMIDIIRFYLERGVRLFRLDAVAFLWKEAGTTCLNLPQTHELIRLMRTLIEHHSPRTIIITETNIPNRENLSYFGNANEAHVIYNFALPPLLLHTMMSGSNRYINNWLMSMPPAQDGTTYLNFIASHDGIGLRPVENILDDEEITKLTDSMMAFGGRISWRKLADDQVKPYEINIALFDALSGTFDGKDDYQIDRFICAHAIMLGLEGIPAFYIHSLLATENDSDKMELSGNNRAINRHNWSCEALDRKLNDPTSHHHRVLERLKALIKLRTDQVAFHPNATQYTLHLGEQIFAFWRQSRKREQSIFCIYNISKQPHEISLRSINLVETDSWRDLLSDEPMAQRDQSIHLDPYRFLWITNR